LTRSAKLHLTARSITLSRYLAGHVSVHPHKNPEASAAMVPSRLISTIRKIATKSALVGTSAPIRRRDLTRFIVRNFVVLSCVIASVFSATALSWVTGFYPFHESPDIAVDAQVICRWKSPDELPRNPNGSIDGRAVEKTLTALAEDVSFIFNDQPSLADVAIGMPHSYITSIVKCTAVRLSIRGRYLDHVVLALDPGAPPLPIYQVDDWIEIGLRAKGEILADIQDNIPGATERPIPDKKMDYTKFVETQADDIFVSVPGQFPLPLSETLINGPMV
jgi:hypothetical protein